jgi:uncharacterized protein
LFEFLIQWVPTELHPASALFLITLSAFTSLVTASLGIGGGALLIAAMAQIIPPIALIPVHGFVQFGSNANRALMTYQHIDTQWVRRFLLGALIGAVLASFVVVQLPLVLIQLSIGVFILWMLWGPKPQTKTLSASRILVAGTFTTFISMFVGATGPLVGSLIHRRDGKKMTKVATMAAALTGQHLLKGFVFAFVGFSFMEWLPLIVAMIASGAIGTYIGLHFLKKFSSERFNQIFRLTITLLALRLIYQAILEFL